MEDTGFPELRARIEAAARLHKSGQRAIAISAYRQLLQQAPRLPPLLNLLGLALVQEGEVQQGLQYLSKAVRLAPEFGDAWLNLAFARFEAQDRDGAAAAYRQVLTIQPNHVSALLSLASLLSDADAVEAVVLLRRAVAASPDRALPWLRLRRACLLLGDLAGAAEASKQIERLELRAPEELVEGGNFDLMQGRLPEAVAQFDAALKLQPGLASAALGKGEALLLQKDYAGALEALGRAAALAPLRSTTWLTMGSVHLARGERREAAQAFRQALDREDGPLQRYLHEITSGELPATPPIEYLRWRYNARAATYDAYQRTLGNSIVESVGAALVASLAGTVDNALDLGCGTGLIGAVLRPLTRRMIGLDASLAMLKQAQATHRYDDLIEQEAIAYLASTSEKFDAIVAVEMAIHCGDLQPLFEQVAAHLAPGGLFLATFAQPVDGGVSDKRAVLQIGAAFAHAESEVRARAAASGLDVERWESITMPREFGPSAGSLAVFRAPAEQPVPAPV